jgi:CxxC motif-containing protein
MKDLTIIGEELFNKIRGRFPNVTIGDEEGTVTNDPSTARFFDFDYKSNGRTLGKVSVGISEDGLTVIYSDDFIANEDESTQKDWYSFLRELRQFARKRMLTFDARNINKSNLQKRDYKFLAQRSGEGTMTESKLYGTSRISYQNVGEARIMIKHTQSINQESATGRTQKIGKIYVESPEGERFIYPFKHLSGARAMARHVAEGGNAYDDFGKHIVGLSEEMAKLRKFKTYMGRSAVMAESLAGYLDIVKERISTVKKTVESLQKPAYYKEALDSFNPPVLEDVPSDVAENWIDELTIKQFNEELADVFPYIYNLIKEGTKAKELGPEELVDESGLQYYTGVKKHGKEYMKKAAQAGREGASQEELGRLKDKYSKAEKKTKEEFELEQAFEDTMGQFADSVCEECGNPSWRTLDEEKQKGVDGKVCWKGYKRMGTKMKGGKRVDNCVKVKEDDLEEAYIKTRKDAVEALGRLRGIGKKIETGQDTYDGNLANEYVSDVYDVINWMDSKLGISGMEDPKLKQVLDPVVALRKEAKGMETKPGSGKDARFGNKIVNTLYPLMVYIQDHMEEPKDEGNAYAHAVRKAKMDGKKKGDKVQGPDGDEITLEKDDKAPLGEFILSYYDRETGEFPKGETAVLTMVEKDYGEQFIEPAKAFIERVQQVWEEYQMHTQPQQMENPKVVRMRELAGLR